jgi:uroporphyrin-III C-methyltransferase/precorrin-2 dehydrogenase/sirohydrochlorin ferrochelatase
MNFIDLKLGGETVMVIGGGQSAYQTVECFVDSGAIIWVISKDFTADLVKLGEARKVALLKTDVKDAKAFIDSLNPKPYVLIAATGDSKLNAELAKSAKSYSSLVYAADAPKLCDFTLP